jgi:single-stranded DNA-binding protein
MASGATSILWRFSTSSDYKMMNKSLPLLEFRLAFTRYDFQTKAHITEFIPVTGFSKTAEKIHQTIQNGVNYICCKCNIKVSKF